MPEGAQVYRIKFPDDDTTIPAKPSAPSVPPDPCDVKEVEKEPD